MVQFVTPPRGLALHVAVWIVCGCVCGCVRCVTHRVHWVGLLCPFRPHHKVPIPPRAHRRVCGILLCPAGQGAPSVRRLGTRRTARTESWLLSSLTLYGGCSLQLVREVGEPNTMRYRVYMWYEGRKISPWHDLPLTMPEIKPYYTFINEVPKGYAPRSPGASAPGAWLTATCSGLQRDCQVRGEQGGCPEPHHSRHEEGEAAVRALWPACGAHGVVVTLALRVQILPLAKPGKLRGVSADVGEPQREGRNQWLDRYGTGRCGVEWSGGARV